MKMHHHARTVALALLTTFLTHANGANDVPPVTSETMTKIVFTDPATGQKHTLTKDGRMWTGTHPAFDGYGLKLRQSRRNQNPEHILELNQSGSGQTLNLKIDAKNMIISHSTLAPWAATDGSGGIDYRYEAHLRIDSID